MHTLSSLFAQNDCPLTFSDLQLIQQPNQLLFADATLTTPDGWLHFYHCASQTLLLSILPGDQDVGDFQNGLTVSGGTLPDYSQKAFDLSNADSDSNVQFLELLHIRLYPQRSC